MNLITRRTWVLLALALTPLLVYLVLGGYALWVTGLFTWTFWLLPLCWALTWLLAWFWKPADPLKTPESDLPTHFTPRDEAALKIVRRHQEQVDDFTPEQLTDPQFYLQRAQLLARDIAAHYHPKAEDVVSSLTVPEILAAMRLAVEDMERWMLQSVPGSHLITVRQWEWLSHAPKWVRRAQNALWAMSLFVNPANIVKYLASEATIGPVTEELQTEFLAALYLRFVRQTGFYLIEMNSGRLRGGADQYRQTFGRSADAPPAPTSSPAQEPSPEGVTVAFCGQVKAGKSSLVNALIGERVTRSDVLPETRAVSRHRLEVPGAAAQITLLDTPGYSESGASKEQVQETRAAFQAADVLVLVLDAHAPARAADREMLDDLQRWMQSHPELRPSPVILCLTHVDLLSPALEWKPPYNWQQPTTRKEQSIHDAVEYARELFSDVASEVVPVCSDVERGRADNVPDQLLPAIFSVLSEGQMAALLRAYHRQLDSGHFQRVLRQMRSGGRQLLQAWVEERLAAGDPK